jgi:hypothetical protein
MMVSVTIYTQIYIKRRVVNDNPVPNTKKYPCRNPQIYVLNKEQLKIFLAAAKEKLVPGDYPCIISWLEKRRNTRVEI